MRDESREQKQESQINDYIRLGRILQKTRSPLKQEAVNAVLHSAGSLRRKIEEIERIDRADERYAKPPRRREEPVPGNRKRESLPAADDTLDEPRDAKRNQAKIKRAQTQNGFLKYLFQEYGRIKRFGLRGKILIVRFPFRLRINPRALEIIQKEGTRDSGQAILTALERALPNAWRVLEKFEYNCLAACADFCRQLLKTEFRGIPYRERDLLYRFKDLERSFLALSSDRAIMQAIHFALDKLREGEPEREQAWEKIREHLRLLFSSHEDYPSLHHLLLGINMIRWRRFFLLADLIDRDAGKVVASAQFDCPESVQAVIRAFIEEQETKLANLTRERGELSREIALLPVSAQGEADYSELAVFYNTQAAPGQAGTFQRDAEQVLYFLVKLAGFFLKSLRPLLYGMLSFTSSEIGIIFPDDLCGPDFDRLEYSLKKIERHAFSFGSFSRQRYTEIRSTGKTATHTEAEAFSIINEILMSVRAVARKISAVIAADNAALAGEPRLNAGGRGPALIPFADKVIYSEGILAGKKVRDAVRYAARVAYLICFFLEDPAVGGIIAREQSLSLEIEAILKLVQRIASGPLFIELQAKYALAGKRFS